MNMNKFLMFIITLCFSLFYEEYLNASCAITFSGPKSSVINRKEYLRVWVSHDQWNPSYYTCPIEEVTLGGEDQPIKIETNIYYDSGPLTVVEIRPVTGNWGDRNKIEVPIEAVCVYPPYSIIGSSFEVQITDEESFIVTGIKPKILGHTTKEASVNYIRPLYDANVTLQVSPVGRNWIYILYVYNPEGKKYTYYDPTISINRGDGSTANWCEGVYNEYDNERMCLGLEFRIQIKDGYGNLSEISDPYHFYPSEKFMSKYCRNQADGGKDAETDINSEKDYGIRNSNEQYNDESGWCNIINIR